MECSCLVVILCFELLFQTTIAFPFGSKERDGSKRTSETCYCHSVEFWLRETEGSISELPSFEVRKSNWERSLEFVAKNRKLLRLRPRKNCKFLLKNGKLSEGISSFENVNIEDDFVEVWLKDNLRCVSLWMECQQRSICVGANIVPKDFAHSAKRKLLMAVPDFEEKKSHFQLHGIILSAFVLCAMLILIALCGSNERKSTPVVYTGGDGGVEIVSSQKIQSIQLQNRSGNATREAENQKPLATGDQAEDAVTTDRNSKNDAKTSINHDRVAANDDDNNPYSTIRDTADGQVFGKTRRTEGDEDGHKENDNDKKTKKEKEEEARAKRTHSSPPERPEPKGFSKKRFSSKGHSRSNIPPGNGKSVKKADKKKRKKKSQSDDELSPPTTPTSPSKLARDRRSFIGRELPQRPSEGDEVTPTFDNNYAEPFDRPEEDCNYETVENQVTLGVGVSSRKDVVRSHRGSSSSRRPATKRSDVEDDIFYDSVDEKKKSRNLGSIKGANIQSETFDDSDTYEIVKDPTKRRQSGLKQQDSLYECVDSRSVLADYEEPNLTRKRSASDIVTTSSTPVTVAERKSASLQREMTAAPPLPGRDNLRATHKKDDRSQGSDENAEELIEPYTLTRKSGDFILQETSTSLLLSSLKANPQPPNVSPEELEKMYAKVDKEKQIRDRLEMESKAKKKESEKDEVDGSVTEANAEDPVFNDDHDYELVPTLPRKTDDLKDDEDVQLYDEVNVNATSSFQ